MAVTKSDFEHLLIIGDYRFATAADVALLTGRNEVAVRRRLGQLSAKEHLLQIITRSPNQRPGRPENLYTLTETGVDLLRAEGLIPEDTKYRHATLTKLHLLDHECMINRVRVQLVQLRWLMPELSVRFFASRSSLLGACQGDYLGVEECLRMIADHDSGGDFIPDAVVAITHRQVCKTILFFLEADTGTQPLAGSAEGRRDIRHKIANYRSYLEQRGYKRYEDILKAELHGFRLLFLTSNSGRLAGLCRLIRGYERPDFIWSTDRQKMQEEGVWAPIWVRGGQTSEPLESILGTKMPQPCPQPASITKPVQDSGGVWSTIRTWLGLR